MRIQHFDEGSSEHTKPLYNESMGEAHPHMGEMDEGDFYDSDSVGPLKYSSYRADDLESYTSKKTGNTYLTHMTGPTPDKKGNIDLGEAPDFDVSMYPTVQKWDSRARFPIVHQRPATHAPEQVQGTMFHPGNDSHLRQSANLSVEDSDPYGDTPGLEDKVHVALITTQEAHRGQGLAMHMLKTGQQFARSMDKELVADESRTDLGSALGRKAAKLDPHAKNQKGEYLSEENYGSVSHLNPLSGSSRSEIREADRHGGSDEVRDNAEIAGIEGRRKVNAAAHAKWKATKAQGTQTDMYSDHVITAKRDEQGRRIKSLVPRGGVQHMSAKFGEGSAEHLAAIEKHGPVK